MFLGRFPEDKLSAVRGRWPLCPPGVLHVSPLYQRHRHRRRGTVRPVGCCPSPPARPAIPHLRQSHADLAVEPARLLKSEGCASSLSDPAGSYTLKAHYEQYGLSYGEYGVPVPLETFSDYGLKFQQQFVPDVEDTRVLALHRSAYGYELHTATGELLTAKSVVVAVGIIQFRHIPWRLAHLPQELVSHTSHHRSFGAFSGRDVTVIGGGQSALETAALAREQGPTSASSCASRGWSGTTYPRKSLVPLAQRLRRPMTGLGDGWRLRFYANSPGRFHRLPERMRVRAVRTALGPAGAWWLRERVLG
jgi:FAD-dependent urate hydroxylase